MSKTNCGSADDSSPKPFTTTFGDALTEEVWLWNTNEEQLAAWENGKREIPLDWLCRNGLEVATDGLTFANLPRKLMLGLKVRLLYDTPPRPEQKREDAEGGFGRIEKIVLDEPVEASIHDEHTIGVLGIARKVHWNTSEVAVKLVKRQGPQQATCLRIMREARAWKKMKHENIVPLFGVWLNFSEASPVPAFVCPWANQGTLNEYIRRNGNTSNFQRLKLMHDVACALAFMHSLNYPVVHGDLKGNNVLVHDDRALLCDFGISHVLDGMTGTTTVTHVSWAWQAPEYFTFVEKETGPAFKPTPQSDMYAYASVFVEVFTGRRPWPNSSHNARASCPAAIEPQPAEICDEYWMLLKYCWTEDPLLRATANKALERVRAFMGDADADEVD
ncbi:hypothetical protein M0805_008130 [Coniferiporia weirii]|nr:hypothetical protein M0805_008130 [Coniferiporia weirii]